MIVIPWAPALTRAQLDQLANPMSADQPEVVPWILYDSQSFATTSAAPLTFFTNVQGDKTLGNMEGPGQLPDPQYMIVQYLAFDWLQGASAGVDAAVNTAWANLSNVLYTNRATFTFTMSNKNYGPFPLMATAGLGGLTGAAYDGSAAAEGVNAAYANNGIIGSGGFPFSGALVIPPKINFTVTINLAGALTLTNGPFFGRVSLVGQLYRRVL